MVVQNLLVPAEGVAVEIQAARPKTRAVAKRRCILTALRRRGLVSLSAATLQGDGMLDEGVGPGLVGGGARGVEHSSTCLSL